MLTLLRLPWARIWQSYIDLFSGMMQVSTGAGSTLHLRQQWTLRLAGFPSQVIGPLRRRISKAQEARRKAEERRKQAMKEAVAHLLHLELAKTKAQVRRPPTNTHSRTIAKRRRRGADSHVVPPAGRCAAHRWAYTACEATRTPRGSRPHQAHWCGQHWRATRLGGTFVSQQSGKRGATPSPELTLACM